ncbi:MAG: integrase zinc binding domain-containing protein, partial [Flammeovirgaceae bacterium]
ETILFRPKLSEEFKIYPKAEDRANIINKPYHIGHFKAASTYTKLKETYYWRKMFDQIVSVINKCLVCQRNDRINPLHHPALALEVTGIFDRVGMDLVFGL